MTAFTCTRCNRTGRYSSWVTARWSVNTNHRCEYCGTAHCVRRGEQPVAIPPPLLPVTADGRPSPWLDSRFRPITVGVYECEFNDGIRLRLRWDGNHWTWCSLAVNVIPLTKWRGRWTV